jgi:hypothetical protein
MRTRTLLVALLVVLGFSAVAYAAGNAVVFRGWKLYVTAAGNGDAAVAVKRLREVVKFTKAWLGNLVVDRETDRFIDDMWEALEDFDLEDFHQLLPRKKGKWRVLEIYGKQQGSKYLIDQPKRGQKFEVNAKGNRRKLGDTSLVMQARKVPARDDEFNYLIHSRIGIGVGVISWKGIAGANAELFRVIASGDSRSSSYPANQDERGPSWARYRVIKTHTRLGPEDVEVLAIGWSAFPRLAELLTKLARVEDIVVIDPGSDGSYQHLRPTFRMARDVLRRDYPLFADYLDDVSFLNVKNTVDLYDENGRLIRARIDMRAQRISFDLYVRDGKILPVRKGKVRTDVAIDMYERPRQKPWRLTAVSSSRANVLGIKSVVKNARTRFVYRVTERGALVKARTTEVPDIRVSGNALGIMPSAIIDFFIPGSLESLVRDFVTTACKGNNGEGVAIDTRMDQRAPGQPATFDAKLSFEALDNFFVKFGVSVMNDRIIPDGDTWDEMLKLFQDLADAFSADLERFAKIAKKTS